MHHCQIEAYLEEIPKDRKIAFAKLENYTREYSEWIC
jgi:hypothetical protein